MLPRHIFASPVVMFTKSKFKYMSCGGKAINMHAEMMWSLGVPVRGGGWDWGEGLRQKHTSASAPGSRGKSLLQEGESVLATKPVAGLCPPSCCPHGEGAWRCLLVRAVWKVPSSASLWLVKGAGESPCVSWQGAMGERAQRGAGWEGDRQQ